MAFNLIFQMVQQVPLTPFQVMYLDLVNADNRMAVKLSLPFFFLNRRVLLIDLELDTHTK